MAPAGTWFWAQAPASAPNRVTSRIAAGANAPARGKLNFIDPVTQGGERPAQACGPGCPKLLEQPDETRPRKPAGYSPSARPDTRHRAVCVPPALLEGDGQIAATAPGSTAGSRHIDEPFPFRDIQFDDP